MTTSHSAQDVVAAYANFFSLTVAPDITRLTFGEASGPTGEDLRFHTAIATTTANAKALAELILRTIAENEARGAERH